jgi:16S rRNA (guanine966-N2)-methyltransferase
VRIIAGKWRGRRINAPKGDAVRPTGDRVREAWMNIVNPWISGARVLDLFAGSGALGLEALSRGAAEVDFVESGATIIETVRENALALGAGPAAHFHRGDAIRFVSSLHQHAYDLTFADPPYDQGLATHVAQRWIEVPFSHILGIEHRANERLPAPGETRKYGGTVITFYRT